MNLSASGPAASPGKIMFYMGVLFVALGVLIGLPALVGAIFARSFEFVPFGLLFLALFGGIGGFFAIIGYDNMHANDAVLEQGATYLGKIYSYEPDYQITMNGQPCLTLVVRYMQSGQIREARVNTGEVDATRYPRGATVSIRLLDGKAALVPGSVSGLRIEREDDLMNPDFDPMGVVSSVGVACPNCGANIVVPLGMARFCPYCNTKVSVDAEGHLRS